MDIESVVALWSRDWCRTCFGAGYLANHCICECVLRHVFGRAMRVWLYEGTRTRPTVEGMLFRCDVEIAARHELSAPQLELFQARYLRGETGGRDNKRFYSQSRAVQDRVGLRLLKLGIFPPAGSAVRLAGGLGNERPAWVRDRMARGEAA